MVLLWVNKDRQYSRPIVVASGPLRSDSHSHSSLTSVPFYSFRDSDPAYELHFTHTLVKLFVREDMRIKH